ncbi:unnamed protein product [Leptidea sinapis]|uniref:Uncharacterized protein n=1 Tax=Leptidea sinapis TaxID=189913 RepID=A0A5E4R3S7_9NEOP|nr:unnamed protein product [Leptidea sinapis]
MFPAFVSYHVLYPPNCRLQRSERFVMIQLSKFYHVLPGAGNIASILAASLIENHKNRTDKCTFPNMITITTKVVYFNSIMRISLLLIVIDSEL